MKFSALTKLEMLVIAGVITVLAAVLFASNRTGDVMATPESEYIWLLKEEFQSGRQLSDADLTSRFNEARLTHSYGILIRHIGLSRTLLILPNSRAAG